MVNLVVSLISAFRKQHGRNPDRITMSWSDAESLLDELISTATYAHPDTSGQSLDETPSIRPDDGFFAYICGVPTYAGDVKEGQPIAEATK